MTCKRCKKAGRKLAGLQSGEAAALVAGQRVWVRSATDVYPAVVERVDVQSSTMTYIYATREGLRAGSRPDLHVDSQIVLCEECALLEMEDYADWMQFRAERWRKDFERREATKKVES